MQPPPPVDTKQSQAQANAEQPLFNRGRQAARKIQKDRRGAEPRVRSGPAGFEAARLQHKCRRGSKSCGESGGCRRGFGSVAPAETASSWRARPNTTSGERCAPVRRERESDCSETEARPTAQLDANGNPIPPKPKPVQQPKLDANGNPIRQTCAAAAAVRCQSQPDHTETKTETSTRR